MASYTVVQIQDRDDAKRLVEISEEPKLSLSLAAWQNIYSDSLVAIENKRSRKNSAKTEVYQLLGFYAVFQGVVLTAVMTAQTTVRCYNVWGPLALSALFSFAMLLSVRAKLRDFMKLKRKLSIAVTDSQVTLTKIRMLKGAGKAFDFTKLPPGPELNDKSAPWTSKENRYYYSIMGFLVLFSLVILMCCFSVLCGAKLGEKIRGKN